MTSSDSIVNLRVDNSKLPFVEIREQDDSRFALPLLSFHRCLTSSHRRALALGSATMCR